jgi:hypothetical protein
MTTLLAFVVAARPRVDIRELAAPAINAAEKARLFIIMVASRGDRPTS